MRRPVPGYLQYCHERCRRASEAKAAAKKAALKKTMLGNNHRQQPDLGLKRRVD